MRAQYFVRGVFLSALARMLFQLEVFAELAEAAKENARLRASCLTRHEPIRRPEEGLALGIGLRKGVVLHGDGVLRGWVG